MLRPPEKYLLDEGFVYIPIDELEIVPKNGSQCLKVDEMMALLLADVLKEAAGIILTGQRHHNDR